eukprot:CAMPEP_0116124966 /NCGR_PEP_ID=MMETSP0329-20121206/5561_1 /TAXON_ID=697910 /ORGANISM="Pseudo-nitzschia arenysensis, Strain B593" /LENGTH=1458 /DNA_ID=CAMNT_0003618979 /DNA_START=160 /DNA_END=4536 /DNA_ORIENTATION=-
MPKEDRSSWVAVAPQFSNEDGSSGGNKIKPPQSSFSFWQKENTEQVKAEHIASNNGKFEVGLFSRAMRDKWNSLEPSEKEPYEDLARRDQFRFRSESHQADVAAMERRERLQKERATLLLDDIGGTQRGTRGQRAQKERKEKKRLKKKMKKKRARPNDDEDGASDENYSSRKKDGDDDDYIDEAESSEDDYSGSDSSDSSDSERKKKAKRAPRKVSAKQLENRRRAQEEKKRKEAIIAEQQEDIQKEKAAQAKKRLEFLLKQSSIFSHFGQVKQDQAKFGIKTGTKKSNDAAVGSSSRRDHGSTNQEEELEEADEHQATFLTSQPTTLGFGKMREYQLEGLNWMIRLQENGVNGILADEMGLGKTLQSISVLVYMMEFQNCNGPHLIIVPKSTLSNWMNELARWAPTLNAVKFHGDKASREEMIETVLCPGRKDSDRDWNVVVTTYEICNIEKNTFMKFAWSYLIIDEAHRLKNEASTFSKTVRMFETRYRILLTGTPLQNSLHELWALLNFLVPDVFASADQFDEWFNLDIEDNDEKNRLISQLHKILRPFMLRRLKKEVEKSLPPKHETILFTGMSAMQKKLYRDILIRDIDSIQGTSGSRTAILNIVMQLRKCAGHPYLFPGVEDRTLPPLGEHLVENCGKMVLLDKLLKRLQERGSRILLFTQMTRILDIMEDYLVMRRFQYCRIDGNTTYEVRENYIDAYNAPNSEKFLFLLSTRAGGLGINLQTADVVILYDSDWNPQADLQAQDRAHRIGQKKEVQVFRLVTEHTIEEKIVERAQQKLKLDAMVVQQGRLKDKDKLSRNELLEAVRFGADKIFKSKDSSITDEDIDLIINAGKRKTQELNDKFQAADKGDLLDFKLDGNSNMQTFEGVDYSGNALAAAKAEVGMLGILDLGKRERKTVANYNENKLYADQVAAMKGSKPKERKKKKPIRLPKSLRLPRMEEWQMFNRTRLLAIQEEEEVAFRALPEEVQTAATAKKRELVKDDNNIDTIADDAKTETGEAGKEDSTAEAKSAQLPPLLSEEVQKEKSALLQEGFLAWSRVNYTSFIKASAKHGRSDTAKIAVEVGKSEAQVIEYSNAFWGAVGKERFSEHEYNRVSNLVAKGEKKLADIKALRRGVQVFVSLFDNPWENLQFTHVNTKDKLFSADNDRYLLCWTHKYGIGQWGAVKMAIRRSQQFRFDYFFRSLPVDVIGRRCETLMKAALKEVEFLEKKIREDRGLPIEAQEGNVLPPMKLPKFKDIQRNIRAKKLAEREREKKNLEDKVENLEHQIEEIQNRLKQLSRDPDNQKENFSGNGDSILKEESSRAVPISPPAAVEDEDLDETKGALGPEGDFVEFPPYDGSEPPKEPRKAFAQFCQRTRKSVKNSLDPEERRNKEKVNGILRARFTALLDDERQIYRGWAAWDKLRYARDVKIFEKAQQDDDQDDRMDERNQVPKKRNASNSLAPVPKKKKI